MRPSATSNRRVLVVGCGGIGGVVAATLSEHASTLTTLTTLGAGLEVVALTTNPAIASAVQQQGFHLRGSDGARTVPGTIVTSLPDDTAPFDWILLATQPPQVEEAARSVQGLLGPDGAMVCFQNGLCESRIERLFPEGEGRDRVVGAVIAWGASMPEPGVYERTSAGGFTIGRMDGADDPRLSQLDAILEPIGPVTVSRNLAGARWSKLAINCAISTLGTLGGARLGALMTHRFVRRLALEIMTEVVAVARAERVRLEKVSGTIDLEWIALTPDERRARGSAGLVAKHSMLLAVGARYRRMRSSMLAAIERGRTPAVDFLNGEVVSRGRAHGIPPPINAEAQRLVHALAHGEVEPGMALLHDLSRRVADLPDR
ncbi:MAG: 2-dehydropantoate 2-reductase [Deltaproteobacteria bacterium]|nr:2-dehydropantoate 2-reductase [Deltaproteobacteria bacterium]